MAMEMEKWKEVLQNGFTFQIGCLKDIIKKYRVKMKKYREHWAKTENRTKTQTTTQIKLKTKTKRHLGIPKPAATKLSILDTQSIHLL